MEVDPHQPEEILGPAELAQLGAAEQPLVDQLGDSLYLIGVFADPVERVQVAQAALALLQVRLDDIAAVAHALVPLFALDELFGGEGLCRAGDDFLAEPRRRLLVQRLVAPDEARLQQGGANRQIGLGHPHHVIQRARRMADLQPEIPQDVEHRLDDLLTPAGLLPRRQEQQVDVRIGRHLAAPVTADRNQRQPFRRGAVGGGIQAGGDRVEQQAQQLIDEKSLCRRQLEALRPRIGEAALEFGPAVVEGLPQAGGEHAAPRAETRRCRQFGVERLGQRAAIDDGAAVGDRVGAGGHGQ